jgi:hypothetical protein
MAFRNIWSGSPPNNVFAGGDFERARIKITADANGVMKSIFSGPMARF